MEEVKDIEGTSQASIAPVSFDLLGSLTDPEPLISLDFDEKAEAEHDKHQNEDAGSIPFTDFHENNCKKSVLEKFEEKGTSPDVSTDEFAHSEVQDGSTKGTTSKLAERFKQAIDNRVLVDTAAPIESVKDAVNKFGGILDWKERRKHVQLELDKVHEEVPECQKKSKVAEDAKTQVLQELGSTKRLIEELRLSLEKAQTEEAQAQQDSELAELRFKEMQQGIAHRESTAAKAELELAKDRLTTAIADLQSVKEELESLKKEYTSLVAERDIALRKAQESTAPSQEIEKTVEDLTLELITLKELLDSSHAAHVEAEEQRINVALAFEQDKATWQNELKQADEELQHQSEQQLVTKDLESKLAAASALLLNLRAELFAYVEGTLSQESVVTDNDTPANDSGEAENPTDSIRVMLERTKKELEDVKGNIEKAKDEVKCLRVAAASLRSDLEKEKADLAALRQKEGLALAWVSSLEDELSRINAEFALVQERAKENSGKAVDLPMDLTQATQEADQTKLASRLARDEVMKAGEEADQAKAEVNAMEMRLEAVLREILAAKTSEELAMASINALQESEQAAEAEPEDSQTGEVTLPLEEYNELSKKARETEDLANKRVIKAVEKIKKAKEAEARNLEKLEELTKQIDERKKALKAAQEKADEAQDGKLAVEQELRKWRAEHEQRRKAGEAARGLAEISNLEEASSSGDTRAASGSNPHILSPRAYLPRADTLVTPATGPKSRKSFFPRIVMFLARKKAQSLK